MESLIDWFLKVMLHSVKVYRDSFQAEYANVLHSAALASDAITDSKTVTGLLFIAKSEDAGKFFCVSYAGIFYDNC